MTPCVLSYAEAESFDVDLFFHDHDLSERDPGKASKRYHCLYCDTVTERSEPRAIHYLYACGHCGWWQVIIGGRGFGLTTCSMHRGVLKQFPVDALDVPLRELRAYLHKHPNDVSLVNPTAFERLMGACLKDKSDSCEVVHVGGTADGGIDLVLIRLEEGPRLIQVKRRANLASTEGVRVVRELNGVLFRRNIARGMVITTASKFSKAAIKETEVWTPTGETYDMALLAYDDVVDLFDVEPRQPHEPWLPFLGEA